MTADYVLKIGVATEEEAKLALSLYLLNRFEKEGTFKDFVCPDGQEAAFLAASSAMNVVFGEIDLERPSSEFWRKRTGKERAAAREHVPDFTVQFASENAPEIEKEINRLSSDNSLCSILSGAAYNISYARYVRAGGRLSIFSHPFQAYIRKLFGSHPFQAYIRKLFGSKHADFHVKTYETIIESDSAILLPFETMQRYMILRPFPRNPDVRAYYNAVHKFTIEMQKVDASASERRSKETDREKQEAPQVA